MYRADGPEELRCVGETEFVNGVAAMTGERDLRRRPRLRRHRRPCRSAPRCALSSDVLRAHIAAGRGRFRGIRQSASYDDDPDRPRSAGGPRAERASTAMRNSAPASRCCIGSAFRSTRGCWSRSFLISSDLARAPSRKTTIVLDHVGTPLGVGTYEGRRAERFGIWRDGINTLAACENVVVKLGGLADAVCGIPWSVHQAADVVRKNWPRRGSPISTRVSKRSARRVRCSRATFPSTLHRDYDVLWNALKRIASGYCRRREGRPVQRHGGARLSTERRLNRIRPGAVAPMNP